MLSGDQQSQQLRCQTILENPAYKNKTVTQLTGQRVHARSYDRVKQQDTMLLKAGRLDRARTG